MEYPTTEQIRRWAERIPESDREAYDSLFRSFYSPLVVFAWRYTKSKEAACDIVQDVFVQIWQERRNLDPQRSVKSYLYTMVRNKALNHIRSHSFRTTGLDQIGDNIPATLPVDEGDDAMSAVRLREWIDRLPDRRREAFRLSRYDGLDHDEIAEIMNISVKTVNNHIVAALKELRERYQAYNGKANPGADDD